MQLMELLSPQYFDDILKTVKSLCVSSVSADGHHVLDKPSLALRIGESQVKCCHLKKGMGIRENDKDIVESAEYFLQLDKTEWTDDVSSTMALT